MIVNDCAHKADGCAGSVPLLERHPGAELLWYSWRRASQEAGPWWSCTRALLPGALTGLAESPDTSGSLPSARQLLLHMLLPLVSWRCVPAAQAVLVYVRCCLRCCLQPLAVYAAASFAQTPQWHRASCVPAQHTAGSAGSALPRSKRPPPAGPQPGTCSSQGLLRQLEPLSRAGHAFSQCTAYELR